MNGSPTSPRPPRKPASLLRRVLGVLLRAPLIAVPFALFFWLLNGNRPGALGGAYLGSLVFALVIGLVILAVERLVVPRLRRALPGPGQAVWVVAATYAAAGVVGSFASAFLLQLTIAPRFLDSAREVLLFGLFSLIFSGLFIGAGFASRAHRQALERARADQELDLARRIQRSFLLSSFPALPRFEVHALNVSSKQVSGDFYDVVPAGEDAFLLAIADVSGKGVPAALLSSMLQASLRTQAQREPSVGRILEGINGLVCDRTPSSQFATFFLARIEERALRLSYSNAGHNYPVLFRRGGGRRTLERGGTVVGILDTATFEEESVTLEPGDRVVFYTDGITEAVGADGTMFGEERLERLIGGIPEGSSARETVDRILEGVRGFLGDREPGDDMTLMVLRVLDAPPTDAAPRPAGGTARG